MGNPYIDGRMFSLNGDGQGESLFLFAMDDEDGGGPWVNGSHIPEEIVPVGMGGQAVGFDDLSPSWRRRAEDRHYIPAFGELAADCMFRLKADKHDIGRDIGAETAVTVEMGMMVRCFRTHGAPL